MKDILTSCIDFVRLGGYDEKELKMETLKAAISEDSKVLNLTIALNFVLPMQCIDKFKRKLVARIEGIEDVDLKIEYRDVIQPVKEQIGYYIDHMIAIVNGKYAPITKTIYSDKW